MPTARIVVVGGGIFGLAAARELARRGHRVTLVDRADPPTDETSSVDLSRAVRMDYGADRFFVELARTSIEHWREWNRRWGQEVYREVGFLLMTREPMRAGGFEADGFDLLTSLGVPVRRLDEATLARDFPLWAGSGHVDAYFNPVGGWVDAEIACRMLREEVRSEGVGWRAPARVVGWTTERGRLRGVVLDDGDVLAADRVVCAAGAWSRDLVPALRGRVRETGQPVYYLRPSDPDRFGGSAFPVWGADIARTGWYGFPLQRDGTIKIGHHGAGVEAHPDRRGTPDPAIRARFEAFVASTLPGLRDATWERGRFCMYTDSVDGDFWIDEVPELPGLIVATGGSGHAFKFAPVVGGIVADAVEGRPRADGGRLAWRDVSEVRTEQARFAGEPSRTDMERP